MRVDNETERQRERERENDLGNSANIRLGKMSMDRWIGRYNPVPVNENLKMIEIPSCVNETLNYKMTMSLSRVVFA